MGRDEALQMCLEYIETNAHERKHVRHAIQAALAQPAQEPFGHWHWEQPMTKPLQGWFVKGPSNGKLNGVSGIALYTAPQEQWNAALDEVAARIGEIKGFKQATQDSFAVFIQSLKK